AARGSNKIGATGLVACNKVGTRPGARCSASQRDKARATALSPPDGAYTVALDAARRTLALQAARGINKKGAIGHAARSKQHCTWQAGWGDVAKDSNAQKWAPRGINKTGATSRAARNKVGTRPGARHPASQCDKACIAALSLCDGACVAALDVARRLE
ncbi:hypothetical protein HAX54_023515, partial [Datura stramonium]|nr:hypothetical protein [Datura stramonium]